MAEARRIIGLAKEELGLTDWRSLGKGDWRKGLAAGIIRKRSLLDNGWLAGHLHMGARNAVSRTIRLAGERSRTYRKARQLARRLEERIASR